MSRTLKVLISAHIINALFWLMLFTGNIHFTRLNADYLTLHGKEDHSQGEVYENKIYSDLLVNDLSAYGSIYMWYGGCDGIFYHRGLTHHLRPLTAEETESLSKGLIRWQCLDEEGHISGFDYTGVMGHPKSYIFMIDGKVVAWIDKEGIHKPDTKLDNAHKKAEEKSGYVYCGED